MKRANAKHLPRIHGLHATHCLYLVALVIAPCLCACAQVDTEQVNVIPPPSLLPASSSASLIRSNVDLVLVNVTVLDRLDRAVTGLQQADFMVQDNNRARAVKYLSSIDEPASLVVVFDASASMATKMDEAKEAVKELTKTSNPKDQLAMIVINSSPYVALHFDDPVDNLQLAIDGIQPHGSTALWDGIYLGVQELRLGHNRRKAIIVISDGGDNHSRYTESELKSVLEESDAEMYAIGIFDSFVHTFEEKLGPSQLDELASVTGGRLFSLRDVRELPRAMTQISSELRNQYVLGYYAGNQDRDGKWHRLKVLLSGQASAAKLRLYSKKGYYASAQ